MIQGTLIIVLIILFLYAILLLVPGIVFAFSKNKQIIKSNPTTFISVIVPVRNEEKAISDCLQSLSKLNYPKGLLEILIVDDHSTDKTKTIAKDFSSRFSHFQVIDNLENSPGKKGALTLGVNSAKGELIVTTDGDCVFLENWLLEIASVYEEDDFVLIAGPVAYKKRKGFFRDLLEIEQIVLQCVSAGAMKLGFPIMCSGANLAYKRDFFLESGGYQNDKVASGDDTLLMLKAQKKHPGKLHFLASRNAMVTTDSVGNLNEAIQQRSRWVSKFSASKSFAVFLTGMVVFLSNFSILFFGLISLCNPSFLEVFSVAFLGKMSIDLLLLSLAVPFFREPMLFLMALPASVFYPLLAMISTGTGLSGKYRWKDRNWS